MQGVMWISGGANMREERNRRRRSRNGNVWNRCGGFEMYQRWHHLRRNYTSTICLAVAHPSTKECTIRVEISELDKYAKGNVFLYSYCHAYQSPAIYYWPFLSYTQLSPWTALSLTCGVTSTVETAHRVKFHFMNYENGNDLTPMTVKSPTIYILCNSGSMFSCRPVKPYLS